MGMDDGVAIEDGGNVRRSLTATGASLPGLPGLGQLAASAEEGLGRSAADSTVTSTGATPVWYDPDSLPLGGLQGPNRAAPTHD